MIYAPLQISATGTINTSWGIGVITPHGAYITSPIPPFTRIYTTAYIPITTTFRRKNGETEQYKISPAMALGKKNLLAYFSKPKPNYKNVEMNITKVVPISLDIIIEEIETGHFKIIPFDLTTKKILQPKNSWTSLIT